MWTCLRQPLQRNIVRTRHCGGCGILPRCTEYNRLCRSSTDEGHPGAHHQREFKNDTKGRGAVCSVAINNGMMPCDTVTQPPACYTPAGTYPQPSLLDGSPSSSWPSSQQLPACSASIETDVTSDVTDVCRLCTTTAPPPRSNPIPSSSDFQCTENVFIHCKIAAEQRQRGCFDS